MTSRGFLSSLYYVISKQSAGAKYGAAFLINYWNFNTFLYLQASLTLLFSLFDKINHLLIVSGPFDKTSIPESIRKPLFISILNVVSTIHEDSLKLRGGSCWRGCGLGVHYFQAKCG